MADIKHDVWERCGYPSIDFTEPLTLGEIAGARCTCCGSELVLEQSKGKLGPFGIICYLSCPFCKNAEIQRHENK